MKNKFISISCTFLLALSPLMMVIPLKAIANEESKVTEKVNAKCHLVLVNGNEGIFFWRLSQNRFSKMTNWVVGSKVLPQESIKEVKVYKVYECVLEDSNFTSLKAQLLDEKTLK